MVWTKQETQTQMKCWKFIVVVNILMIYWYVDILMYNISIEKARFCASDKCVWEKEMFECLELLRGNKLVILQGKALTGLI